MDVKQSSKKSDISQESLFSSKVVGLLLGQEFVEQLVGVTATSGGIFKDLCSGPMQLSKNAPTRIIDHHRSPGRVFACAGASC